MISAIGRREFLTMVGIAPVAWSIAVRAQQPVMPVIGVLRSTPIDDSTSFMPALAEGLADHGYVVGRNVLVDYHSTAVYSDLPSMAADLVQKKVAVIVGS